MKPPKNEWVVLLEHDWLRNRYDVYIVMYTDGGRPDYAFTDKDTVIEVVEGVELPVAQTVSASVWETAKLDTMFRNVYVKETTWKQKNQK